MQLLKEAQGSPKAIILAGAPGAAEGGRRDTAHAARSRTAADAHAHTHTHHTRVRDVCE